MTRTTRTTLDRTIKPLQRTPSGDYLRLTKPQKHHTCRKPALWTLNTAHNGYAWELLAGPGSVWRCRECNRLWEVGFDPKYTIPTYWQTARWTTRWKYRGIR
jgi:hypothetical protein